MSDYAALPEVTYRYVIQFRREAGLDKKQQENIISKMLGCKEDWLTMIQNSVLGHGFKKKYAELLMDRLGVFEGWG